MSSTRRGFLTAMAGAATAAALAPRLAPGRGAELMAAWRTRQFEYTWLRTLGGRYVDFWQVSEDALAFAAASLKLDLPAEKRGRLMHAYLELGAWPDVPAALDALKTAGVRVAFLSNFTARMLDAALANAGLGGYFEPHLSTDRVKAFKPDPRAYHMGIDAFALKREEILFVASAGWDVAGVKWFAARGSRKRLCRPPRNRDLQWRTIGLLGRGAGDVNGDCRADIIVGAYTASQGAALAGKATVYSGCDGSVLRTFTSTIAGEMFGYDAVGVGDLDGDREGDFMVPAATGDRVYLLAGSRTCIADFDRNGRVDARDRIAILIALATHDPHADTNCDGRIDLRDSLNFLRAVLVGCG